MNYSKLLQLSILIHGFFLLHVFLNLLKNQAEGSPTLLKLLLWTKGVERVKGFSNVLYQYIVTIVIFIVGPLVCRAEDGKWTLVGVR